MEKRVIRMLACMIIFTLAAVSVRAQVTDGGFEVAGIPAWSTFNNALQLAAGGMASGVPHGGTHVLQAYGPFVGNWDAAGASETVAVSPGQTVTFNGFIMDPSGDQIAGLSFGLIQLVWLNSANATISTIDSAHIVAGSALDTWIPVSASGVAPAGAVKVGFDALHVNSPANESGSAYFDDLSATIVPEPSSVALALTGLLGLVAIAKKRRV